MKDKSLKNEKKNDSNVFPNVKGKRNQFDT